MSDTRGAPNGAAASELSECVAEERNGGLGMGSRGGSGEDGIAEGEIDLRLPRTMPLPPHLQTLVHEANEELRRWGGWCDVKHF